MWWTLLAACETPEDGPPANVSISLVLAHDDVDVPPGDGRLVQHPYPALHTENYEPYGPVVPHADLGTIGFGEVREVLLPPGAIWLTVDGDLDEPPDCSDESAHNPGTGSCHPTGWGGSATVWVGEDPLPSGVVGLFGDTDYDATLEGPPVAVEVEMWPSSCECED